jgi:hypothetical protein
MIGSVPSGRVYCYAWQKRIHPGRCMLWPECLDTRCEMLQYYGFVYCHYCGKRWRLPEEDGAAPRRLTRTCPECRKVYGIVLTPLDGLGRPPASDDGLVERQRIGGAKTRS